MLYQILIPVLHLWRSSQVKADAQRLVLTSLNEMAHELRLTAADSVCIMPDSYSDPVSGQIESSERRIRRLNQNPASSLSQIASELRRVEQLRPQLHEVRSLQAELEARARQVRTEWLLSQATSRRSAGHQP